ncbi:hypothetical protein [Microbacterium sp. 77mftsu3.1]|uniref:hypothetical protein n=1 Tax=Microbacterium sp. 77mftsu3.1 TaxID=1761802 RepID=UPI000372A281|nr:hypothetical protein [Microbacterium sp. 77mftsu3.1]SDH39493.1 hypothetical protein SAMN04488590_3226 [Microbacterium sp. 77mftsu3.1]
MSEITRVAKAAQDAARRHNGQFGNQEHSMPEQELAAPREIPNPRKGLPLVRTDTADGDLPIIEFNPRDRKWADGELADWQYASEGDVSRYDAYWAATEAAGTGEETKAQAELLRRADAEEDARRAALIASRYDFVTGGGTLPTSDEDRDWTAHFPGVDPELVKFATADKELPKAYVSDPRVYTGYDINMVEEKDPDPEVAKEANAIWDEAIATGDLWAGKPVVTKAWNPRYLELLAQACPITSNLINEHYGNLEGFAVAIAAGKVDGNVIRSLGKKVSPWEANNEVDIVAVLKANGHLRAVNSAPAGTFRHDSDEVRAAAISYRNLLHRVAMHKLQGDDDWEHESYLNDLERVVAMQLHELNTPRPSLWRRLFSRRRS